MICILYQLILWICYPICWGVSEGGNIIAPDSEAVYYGILDILAVPFFSILVLLLTRKLDLGLLGLRSRDYDDEYVVRGEKHAVHHHNGAGGPMLGPERRRSSSSSARARGVGTMDHAAAHNHGTTTTTNGGVVDAGNNTSAGERVV